MLRDELKVSRDDKRSETEILMGSSVGPTREVLWPDW